MPASSMAVAAEIRRVAARRDDRFGHPPGLRLARRARASSPVGSASSSRLTRWQPRCRATAVHAHVQRTVALKAEGCARSGQLLEGRDPKVKDDALNLGDALRVRRREAISPERRVNDGLEPGCRTRPAAARVQRRQGRGRSQDPALGQLRMKAWLPAAAAEGGVDVRMPPSRVPGRRGGLIEQHGPDVSTRLFHRRDISKRRTSRHTRALADTPHHHLNAASGNPHRFHPRLALARGASPPGSRIAT